MNLAPVLPVNRDERFGIMFVPFLAADPRTRGDSEGFLGFNVSPICTSAQTTVSEVPPTQETKHRCREAWRDL